MTRCRVSPVLAALRKKGAVQIAFYQDPTRQFRHRLSPLAGLGKVPQLLAPTCVSRLTRKTPVADPRGPANVKALKCAKGRKRGHGWSITPDNSGSSVPLRSSLTFGFAPLSASISSSAASWQSANTPQKRQQRRAFGFHASDVSRGVFQLSWSDACLNVELRFSVTRS